MEIFRGGLGQFRKNRGFVAKLIIDGQTASFMAGYVHHGLREVNVPILAIDDSFRFFSPGVLLVSEMAKYMMNVLGYKSLYLGRGDEKYKMDMGGACFNSLHLEINLSDISNKGV